MIRRRIVETASRTCDSSQKLGTSSFATRGHTVECSHAHLSRACVARMITRVQQAGRIGSDYRVEEEGGAVVA